jgi:hypothetical protein
MLSIGSALMIFLFEGDSVFSTTFYVFTAVVVFSASSSWILSIISCCAISVYLPHWLILYSTTRFPSSVKFS